MVEQTAAGRSPGRESSVAAATSALHRLQRVTVFSPLGSGRVETVGQRIASAVHLGLLADGEQLPPERDLAAQLSVSPVTLREALTKLRAEGLIETRRGRNGGSFVRASDELPLTNFNRRLVSLSATEWRDLTDEQMAIETTSAYIAAQRASAEDMQRLRDVLEMIPSATTPAERYRADSLFHLEIAVAAQSERLWRVPDSESTRFWSRGGVIQIQLMVHAIGVWVQLQTAAYSAGVR